MESSGKNSCYVKNIHTYPQYLACGLQHEFSVPLVNLDNHGESPCLIGKSVISMAIFNNELLVYRRVSSTFFFGQHLI